ncbi:PepSY domain-containing protein [Salinisphaera aquimarina]|uniref:PepSY domain-containing protein n=1 Tax=Salinisphaera aquimarina TaxID=2094031 RepID=A0ABV7ESM0_9GAMM
MRLAARLREFNVMFQLHWILGITAGAILVVVAVTGALMSFQQEILDWINADITAQIQQAGEPLPPPAIIQHYAAAHPEQTISSMFWRNDRPYPVVVGYRTPQTTGRHGERIALNPATAQPIGDIRGETTFSFIRQLHQRLAAGATGKWLVGVSTLTLVVLCLTGLYVRWQRRPRRRWRWLWPRALGGKLAGEWHAVLGVWALLAYLLASLTGLWWSFDWYRDGARALFASGSRGDAVALDSAHAPLDLDRVWSTIAPRVTDAQTVSVRLPRGPGQPVAVHFVAADAPHRYANDELSVNPATGALLAAAPYRDRSAGDKLLESVYALHMGAFFGLPGIVFMMLASLCMPVFFVTGWLLYLRRRRMKRRVPASHAAPTRSGPQDGAILVAYASQSGLSHRIAVRTADALQKGGRAVRLAGLAELGVACLAAHDKALFIVSTYGEGDAPVAARRFDHQLGKPGAPQLAHLEYVLLALGDSDYGPTYCAFGQRLDRGLRERGARTLLAPIEVDKGDAAALDRWHAVLSQSFGAALTDADPGFSRWTLVERQILNPDGVGAPMAWLRLECAGAPSRAWQAGDIAEIRPRHGDPALAAWLSTHKIDSDVHELRAALAHKQLPTRVDLCGQTIRSWAVGLPDLAARDYSIANIDRGQGVELLVRLARDGDRTGIASGWLIEQARAGEQIDMRLRANPAFHTDAQRVAAPALFIGNGSGMAGLRAHLQARIADGHHDNWLIFGERQRAHDFYFQDEIRAWHEAGQICHLDLAFSRDVDDGRYVQHALAEHGERVRDWMARDAGVFICGSHDSMAPAVIATLREILGAEVFETLNIGQRIRLDVY